MNRRSRYYPSYYRPYRPYYGSYSNYSLYDSQYSNVVQSIYNSGYMDGVSQSSIVNQYQANPYYGWW